MNSLQLILMIQSKIYLEVCKKHFKFDVTIPAFKVANAIKLKKLHNKQKNNFVWLKFNFNTDMLIDLILLLCQSSLKSNLITIK